MTTEANSEKVRSKILELLSERKPNASICPSEVARSLYDESKWREEMDTVRRVATEMVQEEKLLITQKGIVVDSEQIRGPIRLRLPK